MSDSVCVLLYADECTVKPVVSGHSKIDKTKVLKTNGSLMKVESIAECSLGAFCNTFYLHLAKIGLKKQYLVFFFEWPLKTDSTLIICLILHVIIVSCWSVCMW